MIWTFTEIISREHKISSYFKLGKTAYFVWWYEKIRDQKKAQQIEGRN